MSYSDCSYTWSPPRHRSDHYSTNIHIDTPDLCYYSSHYTPRRSYRSYYPVYSPRDSYYYDSYHSHRYGAGIYYPAHSSNWEHSRAAPQWPCSHRIRIRSGGYHDELPSRRPPLVNNTYRSSGRDRTATRPATTTTRHRTTITITSM